MTVEKNKMEKKHFITSFIDRMKSAKKPKKNKEVRKEAAKKSLIKSIFGK